MQQEVEKTFEEINAKYPAELISHEKASIPRHSFHVTTVLNLVEPGSAVADIGGGLSAFAPSLSSLGLQATVIDDFRDEGYRQYRDEVLPYFGSLGVSVIDRDILSDGLGTHPETFDLISSFCTLEHLHHSPKAMLAQARESLKPGGWFFLGVPNCVHLRKRITVPFGSGQWSPMEEWYERPVFRSHVREPDIKDVQYIANDMRLTNVRILGRNWGYRSPRRLVQIVTPLLDRPLRRFPSLCGTLYMIGQKPNQ